MLGLLCSLCLTSTLMQPLKLELGLQESNGHHERGCVRRGFVLQRAEWASPQAGSSPGLLQARIGTAAEGAALLSLPQTGQHMRTHAAAKKQLLNTCSLQPAHACMQALGTPARPPAHPHAHHSTCPPTSQPHRCPTALPPCHHLWGPCKPSHRWHLGPPARQGRQEVLNTSMSGELCCKSPCKSCISRHVGALHFCAPQTRGATPAPCCSCAISSQLLTCRSQI